MKRKLIIFLILFVFCLCASAGFYMATRVSPGMPAASPAAQPTIEVIPGIGSEQHNIVIVQVDQLDAQQPRLETVWFVSIFFMEDVPPSVTFVQLYSPYTASENARALERAFSITVGGEPVKSFWAALDAYDIQYEGYFMVDRYSTQYILEWANGAGDYIAPLVDPDGPRGLVDQSCQSVSGMSLRETTPFDWTGLAPKHFRSNMRMEKAKEYWDKMTSSEQPLRCDLIVTP
jgi:hypothetical protein